MKKIFEGMERDEKWSEKAMIGPSMVQRVFNS